MSKSRAPLVVAAAAAGGIGYYLYGAGGSPKVAEKRFESDVHKASAEVKSHLPGSRDTNVQHNAADAAGRLGAKIDNFAAETDKQLSIAKSNAEAYAKEAKANALQSVNEYACRSRRQSCQSWRRGGRRRRGRPRLYFVLLVLFISIPFASLSLLTLKSLYFKGFIFYDLGLNLNREIVRDNSWLMDGNIMSSFKRVCVFCGSNSGHRQVFSDAAMELGNQMVNRKIDLVYGGGSVGLMGLISKRVHQGGCHVLGVIPNALVPLEISGEAVGEVRVVADMHERKALMASEADAFIALPGGYGTMEEVLEMITWAQLGIHKKPVGLLNVDGYYNSLLALFDNGVKEGFIKPTARDIVLSAPTTKELLDKMELYTPSHDHIAPHESWQMKPLVNHTTEQNL